MALNRPWKAHTSQCELKQAGRAAPTLPRWERALATCARPQTAVKALLQINWSQTEPAHDAVDHAWSRTTQAGFVHEALLPSCTAGWTPALHSFLWLNKTLVGRYTAFCLSVHPPSMYRNLWSRWQSGCGYSKITEIAFLWPKAQSPCCGKGRGVGEFPPGLSGPSIPRKDSPVTGLVGLSWARRASGWCCFPPAVRRAPPCFRAA